MVVVLLCLLSLIWIATAIPFAFLYSAWLRRHPFHGVELALLLVCMIGMLGQGFGLSSLFWHEKFLTQLAAGASLAIFAVLLWWIAVLQDPAPQTSADSASLALGRRLWFVRPFVGLATREWVARQFAYLAFVIRWWFVRWFPALSGIPRTVPYSTYAWAMSWPLGTFLVVAAIFRYWADGSTNFHGYIALPLGAWIVFTVAKLSLRPNRVWGGFPRPWVPLLVGLLACSLLIGLGSHITIVTAIMALILILSWAALISALFSGKPFVKTLFVVGVVLLVAYINGNPYKLTFPHMEKIKPTSEPMEPAALNPGTLRPPLLIEHSPPSALLEDAKLAAEPAKPAEMALDNEIVALREKTKGPRGEEAKEQLYQKLVIRGGMRIRRGDYDNALEDFGDSAGLKDNAGVHALRAIGYAYQGAANYRLFSKLTPKWVETAEGQKLALEALKPLDDALREFEIYVKTRNEANPPPHEAADKLDPLRSIVGQCLALRIMVRVRSGDSAGAAKDLDLATNVAPNSGKVAISVSIALESMGKASDARVLLDAAIKVNPKDADLYRQRAQLLARVGDLEPALADDSQAIELDSEQPMDYEHRANTYDRLNRPDDARKDLNRALHLRIRNLTLPLPVQSTTRLPEGATPLVNDRAALEAWKKATGKDRPVLVIVATSGGGIAAAYWTAKCLTRMEAECEEFPHRLRIVTGASGGMLGAAVYAPRVDTADGQRKRAQAVDDVGQDSLTPVVRRMLLADLPSVLCPAGQSNDRGRTLERTWEQNTGGTTARTFACLRSAENEGRIPSLIISPMLVEDGRFLLISNLDIPGLAGGVQFFPRFPEAREKFQLGTAVRMNAAFPYVTPATSLPIDPPRRVVDAGYLDNYGVAVAAAWIDRHWAWLSANTRGVVLVQLRAYPLESEPQVILPRIYVTSQLITSTGPSLNKLLWCAPDSWPLPPARPTLRHRLATGLEFLTTPVQGLTSARLATMLDRNRDAVARLQGLFEPYPSQSFFLSVELECTADPPLGWSLTAGDRARLDAAAMHSDITEQIAKVAAAIRLEKP